MSADDKVARACRACGAGGRWPSSATSTTCDVCGGLTCYRTCLRCKQSLIFPPSLTGPEVKRWSCQRCGADALRKHWPERQIQDRGDIDDGVNAIYDSLGMSPEEAEADPDRRILTGSILNAYGVSGIATGQCAMLFCRTGIGFAVGSLSNFTIISYSAVRTLQIAGRGKVVTATGTAWRGGGFGLVGVLEGALMADVLNALSLRKKTSVESVVHFGWDDSEIVFLNTTHMPNSLASLLAPVLKRIETLRATIDIETEDSRKNRDRYDFVAALRELADLHSRGALSESEFAAAKARLLSIEAGES